MNEIEKNIQDIFQAAAKAILNKDIDDAEFNLCVNTIQASINYMRSKRKSEDAEEHRINEKPYELCTQCRQWEFPSAQFPHLGICSKCGKKDMVIFQQKNPLL